MFENWRVLNGQYCGEDCDHLIIKARGKYGYATYYCDMFKEYLLIQGHSFRRCKRCMDMPKNKCTGCGWCCHMSLCDPGKSKGAVMGKNGCSMLIKRRGRFRCLLVTTREVGRSRMGIGYGCQNRWGKFGRRRERWLEKRKSV